MTGSDQRRRAQGARGKVDSAWVFVALLSVAAAALYIHVVSGVHLPRVDVEMAPILLLLMFAAAERFVVHVPLRGQAYTATLGEIPMVLGLALADPRVYVLARVVGAGAVLLPGLRRSPVKFFFNVSHFAFEACIAVAIYSFLLSGHHPSSTRGWVAALTTVVLVDTIATAYIALVMAAHEGHFDSSMWRQMTSAQAIAALTNGSLALVAVVLLEYDPQAVLLLVGVLAVLVLLYRAYSQLDSNYARLQILQTFTRSVATTVDTEEVLSAVLEQARVLLRAQQADILLHGQDGQPALGATSRMGATAAALSTEPAFAEETWWKPALDGAAVVAPAGGASLNAVTTREGMAVPLRTGSTVFGVLIVRDRLDDVTTFGTEDLRLFETLGNHAAVSLKNGQLVDQLRHEVTEREYQATHDALTGLPNRRVFAAAVDQALRVSDGTCTAVMIIDLDGFKEVNDTLGHHTGDELLRVVGQRLANTVGAAGRVARLGGDEFAICLPALATPEAATEHAEKLHASLAQPVTVEGMALEIGGSVGVAIGPVQGATSSLLMQRADVAMYQAKGSGEGVEVYRPEEDTNSARRLALVGDLRRSIEARELAVHFQPKVSLISRRAVSAEALVRWTHSEFGQVPPDEFIPLAERAGLIRQLTQLVLDEAVSACAAWRESHPEVGIAVNLSVRNLLDLALADEVAATLARHALPPALLTLEITESHIMSDPARCLVVLNALHALGVTLSIDDFGTGYSSLSYLKRLPVSEVKIDKSFVQGMSRDADDAAIVRGTINLAHDLGLTVVAEGVEDEAAWRQLAAFGCDIAQGWMIGRPVPRPAFERWLEDWTDAADSATVATGGDHPVRAEGIPAARGAEMGARLSA